MGDEAAFEGGGELKAAGANVRVVGLDPLCTSPRMSPGLSAVNIWGNYCFAAPGTVAGARNVRLSGPSHIGYCADPRVQALAVNAALSP
jgi:hypothetical protein